MTVQLNFDASTVDPSQVFEVFPAADYNVVLTEARVEPTKAQDGHKLHMIYTIVDGAYQGRKLFDNLNLWNKSEQATEIAWRQLSGLCHAAGVIQVATVDQLYGIPVVAKVGREDDIQYGPSNTVKGFKKSESAPMTPGAPVVAAPVVAAPVVAAPVVAEPVVAGPVVAEPVVADPSTAPPPWAASAVPATVVPGAIPVTVVPGAIPATVVPGVATTPGALGNVPPWAK